MKIFIGILYKSTKKYPIPFKSFNGKLTFMILFSYISGVNTNLALT